jgi:hypothetical protein
LVKVSQNGREEGLDLGRFSGSPKKMPSNGYGGQAESVCPRTYSFQPRAGPLHALWAPLVLLRFRLPAEGWSAQNHDASQIAF